MLVVYLNEPSDVQQRLLSTQQQAQHSRQQEMFQILDEFGRRLKVPGVENPVIDEMVLELETMEMEGKE
jgi:hypothetical protein